MKPSLLYRIAAVLLLLFAVAHTLGFSQSDPAWGVDALLQSMRSMRFDVMGSSRTYWDLFLALEIPLHPSDRVFSRDHGLSRRGGVAFGGTDLTRI